MSPPEADRRHLVVVPAFHEELSVGAVVGEIRRHLPGCPVLVVDDGSRDRTAERAAAAGAEVVTAPFNLGVGGAMRIGFLYALRNGYQAVVQVDADGQHDPPDIIRVLDALAGADVVVGSRFAGTDLGSTARWRRRVIGFLSRSVSLLCGVRLTDVTSGFRAAGPRALPVLARHYPAEYLGDTIESLVIAHRAGLRIAEVPVTMRSRQGGRPSQSVTRASLYVGRSLLVLLLAAVRSHPDARATGGSETSERLPEVDR